MKHSAKAAACLFCGLVLVSVAGVVTSAVGGVDNNPYQAIVERNVFDLKPPTPPPAAHEETNEPPPNVKLTGISTILGAKHAFFMVAPVGQGGAKGGAPAAKEESYIIKEGERNGPIEVVQIDTKALSVKIKNEGAESVLVLDTSPKLPNSGGGGPPAGPPGAPRMPTSPQGGGKGHNGQAGLSPTGTSLPNRPMRTSTGGGMGAGNGMGMNGMGNGYQNMGGMNGGGYAGGGYSGQQSLGQALGQQLLNPQQPAATPQPTPEPQDDLTYEQKMVMMELQRAHDAPLIDAGVLPPMPPTPLSPGGLLGTQNGAEENGTAPQVPGTHH